MGKLTYPKKEYDVAKISSGTYKTQGYSSKDYVSKSGLSKGLKAHGFKGSEAYQGMTWNVGSKQYKLTFDFK